MRSQKTPRRAQRKGPGKDADFRSSGVGVGRTVVGHVGFQNKSRWSLRIMKSTVLRCGRPVVKMPITSGAGLENKELESGFLG